MATVGFFALAVFGLGALSMLTDADIISVPGLGQAPGIVGMVAALAVFAGLLWLAVRTSRPGFRSVGTIAVSSALGHLLAVGFAVLVVSGEFVTALAVMGGLITGGSSIVLLVAAAIAAWAGVALRRTRSQKPRWPWEHADDDQ